MFEFYKKGQGKWTRGLTMGGSAVIVLLGAYWLYEGPLVTIATILNMGNSPTTVLRMVGVLVAVLAGLYVSFWVSYLRPGTGDFFIAVEGEMKKVSWSSRADIVGSTKVVIGTLVGMGVLLFVVDLLFMVLFAAVGVLQITGIRELFGLSGGT